MGILSVVVADSTKHQLERCAAKAGLTLSDLVRFGVASVLNGDVDLRPDQAQLMLKGLPCDGGPTTRSKHQQSSRAENTHAASD